MIIVKYGGSILNPDGKYSKQAIGFLADLLRQHEDKQFCLVIGGGNICRHAQSVSKSLFEPVLPKDQLPVALDEVGIAVTKINARYLQTVLSERLGKGRVCSQLVTDPTQLPPPGYQVYLATGSLPGHSTDYDMMLLAKTLGAKSAIKISDFPVILDVRPQDFVKEKAKEYNPLPRTTWQRLQDLVGEEWVDGGNYPLDPEAVKVGCELSENNFFLLVGQYSQLPKMVAGEPFVGTRVEG
ncbi:hypothetical protein GF367_04415 [Candidatus Woesearchaeota archaeon]|nr:hypothetical protein [Candidatus Woesearchaeota archaeon]